MRIQSDELTGALARIEADARHTAGTPLTCLALREVRTPRQVIVWTYRHMPGHLLDERRARQLLDHHLAPLGLRSGAATFSDDNDGSTEIVWEIEVR